ncbi:hypothetical protein MMC18_006220 [Xylographa bjoerkii]|nr:hypothetical protein [Xylographa bjoerkii]
MVKKGKAIAAVEIAPESVIRPTEALQEVSVSSMASENTPAGSGKDESHFAEIGNVVDDRPTSSPYTTPPYTLLIGSSKVQYTVLEEYLRVCPKWLEGCITHPFHPDRLPIIDLTADVHDDVGHTLVHYLHTGTYQMLKLPGILGFGQRLTDYRRSVLSYCVARKHGLTGLETLAKRHVTTTGHRLPFFDLLDITAEIYRELPPGEQWFVAFLRNTIDAAFKSDRSLFTRDAFLNRIGDNRSFNLVLVNSIVRNLTDSSQTIARGPELICGKCAPGSASYDKEVELEIPVAADEEPPIIVEEPPIIVEEPPIIVEEPPIVAEEHPILEERGRSSEPRALPSQSSIIPSSFKVDSSIETPCPLPSGATPKDDPVAVDDDWVPLDLSAKSVKRKTKKGKIAREKQLLKGRRPELDFVPEIVSAVQVPSNPPSMEELSSDFFPVPSEKALSSDEPGWPSPKLAMRRLKKSAPPCAPTPPPPSPPALDPDHLDKFPEWVEQDVISLQKKAAKKKSRYYQDLPEVQVEGDFPPQKKDKKKGKKYESSPLSPLSPFESLSVQ